MLICKGANTIGDPILYRSVRLDEQTNFGLFATTANIIIHRKAALVIAIALPDSFDDWKEKDTELGRMLLMSLINLKELSINLGDQRQRLGIRRFRRHKATPTFWSPTMVTGLPFELVRFSGAFSDPASTKALFASQGYIRRWKAIDYGLPLFVEEWELSRLTGLCFSIAPLSKLTLACSIPMQREFPKSKLTRIVVRSGRTGADIICNLSSYPSLESLSICMPHRSNISQTDILLRIIASAPALQRLTFWTFGASPWLDKEQLVSRRIVEVGVLEIEYVLIGQFRSIC